MYFNCTAYIFIYKNITCFPLMYFTTIQRVIYIYIYFFFTRFSLTLIHLSLFTNIFFSPQILDFIKLCTHDFSRVTFAIELSTNLVYKSNFFIDYNYLSIHLLFFFIFSRLYVKHKTVMSRSTHTEI